MWSEACEMLNRAERLHRAFFSPARSGSPQPAWAPPVDMLETESSVIVLIALPGVSMDRVTVAIEGDELVIAGVRALPAALRTAVIHRLELPQGRFERRVRLPAGVYGDIHRAVSDGCLSITLSKMGACRG
jgi:HSP20 family molecular chaperone IbpA